MPAPILLDLTHTSHSRARTGIQRVARALQTTLDREAVAITHDPHLNSWRALQPWELAGLSSPLASGKRGASWPLTAKIRGRARRVLGGAAPALPGNSGLLVPEVFSPEVASALPQLFAAIRGPRVALFHDAIALKYPELTPTKTVARFPAYLQELLLFDGIAAVSEDSRATLLDYWRWLGTTHHPPVQAIPLGISKSDFHSIGESPAAAVPPVILSVGSIEGRKNHLSLLDACEQLWARGARFQLHLIGLAHAQTGRSALERIHTLQAAGRPLRYDGPKDDAAVGSAYATCTFTVYPSIIEGFGLPVVESLAHGKPCICSARGALGESALGGGCVTLDDMSPSSLAVAIDRLLRSPDDLSEKIRQARGRHLKTWSDFAAELTGWMRSLPKRA